MPSKCAHVYGEVAGVWGSESWLCESTAVLFSVYTMIYSLERNHQERSRKVKLP